MAQTKNKKLSEDPRTEAEQEAPKTVTRVKSRNETGTWVYIGPTVPRTKLIANSFFKGSRLDIEKYLAAELEKVPEAKGLIVNIGSLAASRQKVKSTGNYLGKLFSELVARINS